jgi:hypothetical protein
MISGYQTADVYGQGKRTLKTKKIFTTGEQGNRAVQKEFPQSLPKHVPVANALLIF